MKVGIVSEKEKAIVDALPKLSFDEKASNIAAEIFKALQKRGKIPKLKDLFIASIALANNIPLFTCDKDFEVFKEFGLKLILIK